MNHQGTPLIDLALPWKPQTKERPRFVRATGRAYTPKNTLAAEALLLAEFLDQAPNWVPYEGPVHVEYTFTNSHVGVVMREHPAYEQRQLRGDLDNYVKLVSDSLNSHLFKDDRQIVSSHSVKL
jgi:Holliday junction resolvase RusA-like endonuclease